MDKNIAQILSLPEEAEKILIGTLYDISVDDGKNNDLNIPDEWTLERFMEAGLTRDIQAEDMGSIQYPCKINERVVLSEELALNLDNIAVSYQATKKQGCLLPINYTLSTIDSLYIKEKDVWNLIEFKNGNWTVQDIEKKVNGTLRLLGDLELLDSNAILTTNREEQIIEVRELNLKAKLENELGFCASSEFYKNRVSLYIVYTSRLRKAREFLELCSQRNRYSDMEKVLKQSRIFEKRIVSPIVEMGYAQINILATYLLRATTENQFYAVYHNVGIMYERVKRINGVSYQKYFTLLKEIPHFISEIPKFLSRKSRMLFSDNMSPDEFLMQFAIYSIRHTKEEDMPECEVDEYDTVVGLLDSILQKDYSEYASQCRNIVLQFGKLLCEDKKQLDSVYSENFADELQSLINTDFYEAVGRILLIQRVTNKRGCYRLNRRQQEELVRNILHVKAEDLEFLLDNVDNNMESLLKFTALKSYFSRKYACFWNPEQDDYLHMCRQIFYVKELYDEKQPSGESIQELNTQKQNRQKIRTYGCFGTLLHSLMKGEPTACFQENLREKVNRIEKRILAGKSRMEIQPLQMAVQGILSSETIALQQLKYLFEGSVFQKVAGCKGEDFDSVIGSG